MILKSAQSVLGKFEETKNTLNCGMGQKREKRLKFYYFKLGNSAKRIEIPQFSSASIPISFRVYGAPYLPYCCTIIVMIFHLILNRILNYPN